MPQINPLNTFTDGTTTAAAPVMENFYAPSLAPDSLEGMNGWLDEQNVATGGTAWLVDRPQIRPQSMSRARMVGLTGHCDLLDDVYATSAAIYSAIPGASISFYLPRAPAVTLLTWQIVGASDELYGAPGDPDVSLKLLVDGTLATSQFRFVAAALTGLAANDPRYAQRDRIWSGHASYIQGVNGLAAGWHVASIVQVRESPVFSRFRIRNMKYIALF